MGSTEFEPELVVIEVRSVTTRAVVTHETLLAERSLMRGHEAVVDGGMARGALRLAEMQEVASVAVPAGESRALHRALVAVE